MKKAYKNLPEERVRLQVLEFLLENAQWPATRISSETAVPKKAQSGNTQRSDLICYDRNFKPAILIECKAPEIRITEKTAHQIAGYNRHINAPFLYLTNGITDLFFKIDERAKNAIAVDPDEVFPNIKAGQSNLSLTFFLERGFAGTNTSPRLRSWLVHALPEFLGLSSEEIRFLDLGKTPENEPISHYYQIIKIDEQKKLAVTFIATQYGETRIIAVLNDRGKNKGLLEINLELMLKKALYSAILYHPKGTKDIDLTELFNFDTFSKDQIQCLPIHLSEKISSYYPG